MLKTLLTPFAPSTQKQTPSVATMIVTSHDINFMMGFIKEDEIFSATSNASDTRFASVLPSKFQNVSESNFFVCLFSFYRKFRNQVGLEPKAYE